MGIADDLNAAWNAHDAERVAAFYAVDGAREELILTQARAVGREAVADQVQLYLDAMPDLVDLHLDDEQQATLDAECRDLIQRYLTMEDPTRVHPIGIELRLSADVGSLALRGIIDRLDLRDDGELVVVDYKTGRAPSINWEQKSLAGVHFYSFLCEEVLGRRPAAIRLMYLSSGETIEATPSAQSVRFITTRTTAVWQAVERACQSEDFRPRPGALCNSCSFQQWCPAFGGDPDRAHLEAPALLVPSLVTS